MISNCSVASAKNFKILLLSLILLFQSIRGMAQEQENYIPFRLKNDPFNLEIYELPNGLKVYLSVYKNAPRIFTSIAVKAGSKNDPSNCTGLAHYLEHLLFKGTSKIGTTNWKEEQKILDKIEILYEEYRTTEDLPNKTIIYKEIDSLSNIASQYVVPNEYSKMLTSIGTSKINAYTSVEQTVYSSEIPSNEIERWIKIEAERFNQVTPRLFHTELETVYEEKNKNLDNDQDKSVEAIFRLLFPNHQYGTQTTIGTISHLKNPSIKEIKKFFDTYYVPNNMAIFLSGDFNPEEVFLLIKRYWGNKKPKDIPKFVPFSELNIDAILKDSIIGPAKQSVLIGYRLPGASSQDILKLEIFNKILSNGNAGLIDINLVQKQKILSGNSRYYRMKDYSVNLISASPRENQSLDEVKELILGGIETIKNGLFDNELLSATLNNEKVSLMKDLESNSTRVRYFVDCFIKEKDWQEYASHINFINSLSKKDIIGFANKYYKNNYAIIYKILGTDTLTQKIAKPSITPIKLNTEAHSLYYDSISSENYENIKPVFLDFKKDLEELKGNNGLNIYYKKNVENDLFELHYLFDIGNKNNPKYGLALSYLLYLGTENNSSEDIKRKFYSLGCSYLIYVLNDKIQLSLTGLNSNFQVALKLFEELLNNPVPNEMALSNLKKDILKQRENAKLDRNTILKNALVNYAIYGSESPFTNIIGESYLKKIQSQELISIIKDLRKFNHKTYYFGPLESSTLLKQLNRFNSTSETLNSNKEIKEYKEIDFKGNEIYWVHYDMLQAEILLLSKSSKFTKEIVPISELYNQYFGSSIGSIVFQEIREGKGLAYSAYSKYSCAKDTNLSNFNISYLATQADKVEDAITTMINLYDSIPRSNNIFTNSQSTILNNLRTERITKASVLYSYDNAIRLGIPYDIRKETFLTSERANLEDLVSFHNKYIKNYPIKILIIGHRDKIDWKSLKKIGTVKELKIAEIFGY